MLGGGGLRLAGSQQIGPAELRGASKPFVEFARIARPWSAIMLNMDFVSGVSLETLGAMLVSSVFLADFALSEASVLRVVANASEQGDAAVNGRR
jgi:hypothetical protein